MYPKHEKQDKVLAKAVVIREFLDWLDTHPKFAICDSYSYEPHSAPGRINYGYDEIEPDRFNEVLAEYFGIDLERLEAEKAAILDEQNREWVR